MATTYEFGPFRLDADAEMLFRDARADRAGPARGRSAAAAAGARRRARLQGCTDRSRVAGTGRRGQQSDRPDRGACAASFGEAGGADWIETLPRRGYRYVGPAGRTARSAPARRRQPQPPLALPDKPSIAVLPFANLSGDPEQEYFADGMVDDIIAGLSRIKWLFVIARNSSFAYKGTAVDVKQVGRELGVRYLLRRQRPQGRPTASASPRRWSRPRADIICGAERFDRPLDDVFALQDEIALNVVSAIEPSLRRAEVERVTRKRPDSLDAYDLVLQAQPDVDSGMPVARDQGAGASRTRARARSRLTRWRTPMPRCAITVFFCAAGCSEEDRLASVRHAEAAIAHGRDDRAAL